MVVFVGYPPYPPLIFDQDVVHQDSLDDNISGEELSVQLCPLADRCYIATNYASPLFHQLLRILSTGDGASASLCSARIVIPHFLLEECARLSRSTVQRALDTLPHLIVLPAHREPVSLLHTDLHRIAAEYVQSSAPGPSLLHPCCPIVISKYLAEGPRPSESLVYVPIGCKVSTFSEPLRCIQREYSVIRCLYVEGSSVTRRPVASEERLPDVSDIAHCILDLHSESLEEYSEADDDLTVSSTNLTIFLNTTYGVGLEEEFIPLLTAFHDSGHRLHMTPSAIDEHAGSFHTRILSALKSRIDSLPSHGSVHSDHPSIRLTLINNSSFQSVSIEQKMAAFMRGLAGSISRIGSSKHDYGHKIIFNVMPHLQPDALQAIVAGLTERYDARLIKSFGPLSEPLTVVTLTEGISPLIIIFYHSEIFPSTDDIVSLVNFLRPMKCLCASSTGTILLPYKETKDSVEARFRRIVKQQSNIAIATPAPAVSGRRGSAASVIDLSASSPRAFRAASAPLEETQNPTDTTLEHELCATESATEPPHKNLGESSHENIKSYRVDQHVYDKVISILEFRSK